jgi:hypothetical protein
MKVKEEKKVITQEHIIKTFLSDDGKEFQTQKECEKYEENLLLEQLEQKAMTIKHFSFTPILVDNDHEYKWFYVTNQEELDTVKNYYNTIASYGVSYDNVSFPEWVGIEEGYDGDVWEAGTLTQYQKNVSDMVESFAEQTNL